MLASALLIFLIVCNAISCLYWIAAWLCLRGVLVGQTFLSASGRYTHRPESDPDAGVPASEADKNVCPTRLTDDKGTLAPFVSILKPAKGLDAGALENFASFCVQDYRRFELLFGVADPHDPAVELVEKLRQKCMSQTIRTVVVTPLGVNPKAAILNTLAAEARGEVLVISDSDIRVTPDYLKRVTAPLRDPAVGLVTCLYRGEAPRSLPARLEALHMDATFAPSAALALRLGTQVGLGATLAMRRSDLERCGGYAAVADHLLDDYEIAGRIASLGLKVCLSDYPVACVMGATRLPEQWGREVRWARGIRAAHPVRYLGLPLTFSTVLAIAVTAFTPAWHWAWIAIPVTMLVRGWVGWRCAVLLGQRERWYLLWLPLRELMSAAVWVAALAGCRVSWRGTEFVLRSDGRLELVAGAGRPNGILARIVRRLDAHLRRKQGIFEFWDDAECMLRLSVAPAEVGLVLSDGTRVEAGEPVGILHFWNEHLPVIPAGGPDLRWAIAMQKAMSLSLRQLAEAMERDPRLRGLTAFGGNAVLVSRNGSGHVARLARRFGFEWIMPQQKPTFWRRFHDFWENFLLLALQWTFNPVTLRGKGFFRPRQPLWISRRSLRRMDGPESDHDDDARLCAALAAGTGTATTEDTESTEKR